MAKYHHNNQSRYIDRFDVLLLDMGKTFMFDVDRFDLEDNLGQTYLQLGGKWLTGNQVHQILSTVFQQMIADSKVDTNYESMAGVAHYLKKNRIAASLPPEEHVVLETVFAEHEIGVIPDVYVRVLRELRKTHRLGVVSDIWSRSGRFYHELEEAGVRELFDVIVFSSDLGVIKPSGKIFAKAMEGLATDASKVAYVGDSYRRDVIGAKTFGMSAIWIQHDQVLGIDDVEPDLMVNDLSDLMNKENKLWW